MSMPTLPPAMRALRAPCAPHCCRRVWAHALVLLTGALRAPQRRTVTAALRAAGRANDRHFSRYHRVLSRARWSALAVARSLLRLLAATCVPEGPLVLGIDET